MASTKASGRTGRTTCRYALASAMTADPAAGKSTRRSAPLATRMGRATTRPSPTAKSIELRAARAAEARSPAPTARATTASVPAEKAVKMAYVHQVRVPLIWSEASAEEE